MFAMPTVDGLVSHLMSFSTTLVLVLVLEALWDILICRCAFNTLDLRRVVAAVNVLLPTFLLLGCKYKSLQLRPLVVLNTQMA